MAFQVLSLFLLALPIASIAWTITHEELVREFRDVCLGKSTTCRRIYERKFFYLFTCEYCFSHYVTAVFLIITRFKLLYPGWRGYLIAGFALVWVANVYMSVFARIRLEVKRERVEIKKEEKGIEGADVLPTDKFTPRGCDQRACPMLKRLGHQSLAN